jgi:transposase
MPSSTFNSETFTRPIPALPWRGVTVSVALIVLAATVAWELYARSVGYAPTLNDTEDLWTQTRRRVGPESVVIIGESRPLFDLDLDELEKGLGKRPVQLAIVGSCAYPILADLAHDPNFHGTIICSIVPGMFFAPGGPLVENAEVALKRYRGQTLAQRASHHLGMFLEERIAFLKQEDLTLDILLKQLPIPNRPYAHVSPRHPPYFQTMDHERRARMTEQCAQPGNLQTKVQQIWLPLFTPPPPPSYVPKEAFFAEMGKAIEARFRDTTAAVEKLRARGGKIVFVRFPHNGPLKALEDRLNPRARDWERLLKDTKAPGIYYEDFPELSSFTCPEWSHLSAGDSVEFSKRLVPHLRTALQL